MCVSFPTPPEFNGEGREPGPFKLFIGGLAFLAILLLARLARIGRRV